MPQSDDKSSEKSPKCAIVTNAAKIQLFDKTTLQMLNRWIPDKERGHFFTAEAFAKNLDSWKGVPLVFAQEHPDLPLFASDPKKALSMVKTLTGQEGRVVGNLVDPMILTEGHPRFMGALPIADKEVKALWDAGKLSLSTAFLCDLDTNRHISGGIEPNHILLFEETDITQPADKGALVNQAVIGEPMANEDEHKEPTPAERVKKMLTDFETSLMGMFKPPEATKDVPPVVTKTDQAPAIPPVVTNQAPKSGETMIDEKVHAELKNQVDVTTKERDDLKVSVANLDKVVKEKDTEIAQLKNTIAETDKKEKDVAFEAFLKQIKPALYNTEELKVGLRKEYDENPTKLLAGIANMLPDTSKETGETGTKGGAQDDKKAKTTVGCLNPITKEYE